MSEYGSLQDILDNGVRAARAGDKATAKKLLKQVLAEDPDNELALIWLASSVTSPAERRMYLQQVVRVNPNNTRAKQALSQLSQRRSDQVAAVAPQFEIDQAQRRASNSSNESEEAEGGLLSRLSPFEIGLIIALAMALGVGFLALSSLSDRAAAVEAFTNTPTPVIPSNTPRPTDPVDVIVTREPATLPPTFTPTATATETQTPTPTQTAFPIVEFQALLIEREQDNPDPILYRIDGLAQNPQQLARGIHDVIYDLSGQTIAIVKDVTYPPDESSTVESTVSEIFIAPASNPEEAEQITFTRIASAHSPTFSPQSNQVIFVSDFDGDDELWVVDINSRIVTKLTDNNVQDRDPHWSPDGTQLLFSSDRQFEGSYEVFVLEFVIQQNGAQLSPDESPNIITQLTNDQGSSLQPKWSDDGNWITYVNDGDGDSDVMVMDKDGLRRRALTLNDLDAEDRNPSFTPDGRYISFISNRQDDRFQAYLISFDGREVIRLTQTENIAEVIDYRPMLIFRVQSQN